MSDTRTYRGTIKEGSYSEGEALYLTDDLSDPLAKRIEDDIDDLGRFLSVRYFISAQEQPLEALEESLVREIVGAGDARLHAVYSEITGYLWTNEDLEVGGHDLLSELYSHEGHFVHLEIRYDREAP